MDGVVMRGMVRAVALALVGFVILHVTFTDRYLAYVKSSLKWPLILCGVIILALAAYEWIMGDDAAAEPEACAHEHHDDQPLDASSPLHAEATPITADGVTAPAVAVAAESERTDHHPNLIAPSTETVQEKATADDTAHARPAGSSKVAWLYVIPFILLVVVEPPALGAASAANDSGVVKMSGDESAYGQLPPGDPVKLPVREYWERATYDMKNSLEGRQVQLTGFASEVKEGEGWALTRMMVACCAADGIAVKVLPRGAAQKPAKNSWWTVTGRWKKPEQRYDFMKGGDPPLPFIEVESMTPLPTPPNPYE